jgi:hypothetical protein
MPFTEDHRMAKVCRGLLCRSAAFLLATLVLLGAAPAMAQAPGSKLPGGTVVPDITGIWERIEGIRFNPAGQLPPYNAEYRRRYELAMEARNRGERVADPTSRCLPQGMPRFMVASYPLEILQTKGQVTIIAEWSSQVRRIFTDGRSHPPADEMDITFNGHSVGRWEGQVLAVDTVGIRGDTSFDASPMTHSDQLTVAERVYLKDPNTLVAELTVTDPGAFTAPWKVVRTYRRGGPDARIMEYVCEENNREIILPGQNEPRP